MEELKTFYHENKLEVWFVISMMSYTYLVSKMSYRAGLKQGIIQGIMCSVAEGGM